MFFNVPEAQRMMGLKKKKVVCSGTGPFECKCWIWAKQVFHVQTQNVYVYTNKIPHKQYCDMNITGTV